MAKRCFTQVHASYELSLLSLTMKADNLWWLAKKSVHTCISLWKPVWPRKKPSVRIRQHQSSCMLLVFLTVSQAKLTVQMWWYTLEWDGVPAQHTQFLDSCSVAQVIQIQALCFHPKESLLSSQNSSLCKPPIPCLLWVWSSAHLKHQGYHTLHYVHALDKLRVFGLRSLTPNRLVAIAIIWTICQILLYILGWFE